MVSFKKLRQMVQVKGNGNIVSKSFPISSFLRLHIAVRGVTELIQSQEEKIEVEMDENLLEHFEVGNAGRTLYVSTEGKMRTPLFTKAIVRIYFRQIDQLVIRCDGGDVITPQPIRLVSPLDLKVQSIGMTTLNIQAPQLKVVLQSEGDCKLAGECVLVNIKNQSEGHLFAKDLHAHELILRNQADGNVEVFASEKISIFHSGTGYVHYYGDAQLMEVRHHGQSELRHL
jgi:Putative auto-transporter adhesin, head GIN domain